MRQGMRQNRQIMKQFLCYLQLLVLSIAIPITGSAALILPTKSARDKQAPRKLPLVGVYVNYLHLKPGQLSFRVSGKYVKSSNETWNSVEDPTVKTAILSAFYQHKSIDITDYLLPSDKKSNTILAKELTLHSY